MGHGPGRGMMPGEKAKNFTGTIQKLFAYLGSYRIVLGVVILFAIGSTVFNIIGPKVLSKVTTELFNGLVAKVSGTGGIDFEKIGRILLLLLGIYCISAVFNFIQGWLMTGVTQKLCYRMRKEISEKINRMPMKYFESRTVGEVLSRITNDVDTLGQSLNQSVTQLITSIATMIGVDYDAVDQSSDDADRTGDSANFRRFDRICGQTFPEIFRGAAELSR